MKYISKWIIFNIEYSKIIIWFPGVNDTFFHNEQLNRGLFKNCNIYLLHPLDYHPGWGKKETNPPVHTSENVINYFDSINSSISNDIIAFKNKKIVIYSHSTGSLVAIKYLRVGKYKNIIDGLILDDPFLEPKSYINRLLFSYTLYIPLFWKFKKGLITFNKDYLSQENNESNIKKTYKKQGYELSLKENNDYSAYILMCGIEQNYIKTQIKNKKKILKNLPVLTLLATDHDNEVLVYKNIKKYSGTISSNMKYLDVDSIHQCIMPINKEDFEIIFKNINTFIDNIQVKKTKKIIKENLIYEKMHGRILVVPNLIFYILITIISYKIFNM